MISKFDGDGGGRLQRQDAGLRLQATGDRIQVVRSPNGEIGVLARVQGFRTPAEVH